MIVHGHPTGNQFFKQAALAFLETGKLEALWTCIAATDGNLFKKLSGIPGLSEIRRRTYPDELADVMHLMPWRELGRLFANRIGLKGMTRGVHAALGVDQVYWALDRKMANTIKRSKSSKGLVYAYDDGALRSFESAKDRGWKTVLDLPIAYWETMETLLSEEALRYPDWASTLLAGDMPEIKKARKTRELKLADKVICPSYFVKNSIPVDPQKPDQVEVVPFGTPGIKPRAITPKPFNPFKLLFVGGMSQRKGLADVFKALELLNSHHVELHILGDPLMSMDFYRKHYADFTYHITRNHEAVLDLMQQCHALILPSILEGRAQVQQEALACGLPLIVTTNAGGEDLIDAGKTGYLVPIRNPEGIAEAIEQLLQKEQEWTDIQNACRAKVIDLSWEQYGSSLKSIVLSLLSDR